MQNHFVAGKSLCFNYWDKNSHKNNAIKLAIIA